MQLLSWSQINCRNKHKNIFRRLKEFSRAFRLVCLLAVCLYTALASIQDGRLITGRGRFHSNERT